MFIFIFIFLVAVSSFSGVTFFMCSTEIVCGKLGVVFYGVQGFVDEEFFYVVHVGVCRRCLGIGLAQGIGARLHVSHS